jgi:hypothetical protein
MSDLARHKLETILKPLAFDGTEAVNRLVLILQSPSRPADLRQAIASILRPVYRDCVPVDAAINAITNILENES